MNTEENDIQAQIAELREAREKREAERAKRHAASAVRDELAREQRMAKEDEIVEALVAEHGELGKHLAIVETDGGIVVLKRSNQLRYDKFIAKSKFDTESVWEFVRPCIAYPTVAEFTSLRELYTQVLWASADAVCDLHKVKKKDVEGK